jgi:hypothetical protein
MRCKVGRHCTAGAAFVIASTEERTAWLKSRALLSGQRWRRSREQKMSDPQGRYEAKQDQADNGVSVETSHAPLMTWKTQAENRLFPGQSGEGVRDKGLKC